MGPHTWLVLDHTFGYKNMRIPICAHTDLRGALQFASYTFSIQATFQSRRAKYWEVPHRLETVPMHAEQICYEYI